VAINDPVTTVKSLLSSNWNASNTDSTTPTFGESWALGKKNLKNGDIIYLYEVSGTHDYYTVGKSVDKGTWRISIDISTATSRSRLRKLYGEVVRIMRGNEASPGTDYSLIKPTSRVDQTDKNNRWYRYVLDCELISYEAVS
jgi:RNase P protein component|tara:strand:+ start:75 stop:500 length:426 start_codon:yes stop_codon:yes gene_type:complete